MSSSGMRRKYFYEEFNKEAGIGDKIREWLKPKDAKPYVPPAKRPRLPAYGPIDKDVEKEIDDIYIKDEPKPKKK